MSDDHASGIRTHGSITSRSPGMANWKVRGQKLRYRKPADPAEGGLAMRRLLPPMFLCAGCFLLGCQSEDRVVIQLTVEPIEDQLLDTGGELEVPGERLRGPRGPLPAGLLQRHDGGDRLGERRRRHSHRRRNGDRHRHRIRQRPRRPAAARGGLPGHRRPGGPQGGPGARDPGRLPRCHRRPRLEDEHELVDRRSGELARRLRRGQPGRGPLSLEQRSAG